MVLLAVMVVAGGFVPGAEDTAEVTLKGNVNPYVNIETLDGGTEMAFDLDPDTERTASVTLVEKSNKSGYTVVLASTHDGNLKLWEDGDYYSGTESEAFVGYTAEYGPDGDLSTVDLSGGSATVASSGNRTTGTGVEKVFQVSATASDANYAGEYRDDLTFTITVE